MTQPRRWLGCHKKLPTFSGESSHLFFSHLGDGQTHRPHLRLRQSGAGGRECGYGRKMPRQHPVTVSLVGDQFLAHISLNSASVHAKQPAIEVVQGDTKHFLGIGERVVAKRFGCNNHTADRVGQNRIAVYALPLPRLVQAEIITDWAELNIYHPLAVCLGNDNGRNLVIIKNGCLLFDGHWTAFALSSSADCATQQKSPANMCSCLIRSPNCFSACEFIPRLRTVKNHR